MRGVSASPDITEDDILHRHGFRAYVESKAKPWHREHLSRLYKIFDSFNEKYCGGKLVDPYIMLGTPRTPQRLGECGRTSDFGGKSQITIRPSLLAGTHPSTSAMSMESRIRFVEDVMLHELVHLYHQEITGETDEGYSGHGPAFRDMCNRIGAALGLPKVRTSKKRGKDADLPSCAHWPHGVRPEGYYGARQPREKKTGRTSSLAGAWLIDAGPTPEDPEKQLLDLEMVLHRITWDFEIKDTYGAVELLEEALRFLNELNEDMEEALAEESA